MPQEEQHSGESADRIARLLLEENGEVLQAAKDALKQRLMRTAMQMALAELGDPEKIAEQVHKRLGADPEVVVQASNVLRDRLLDDIAERSVAFLADPAAASSEALRRLDRSDERVTSSENAMKERLMKQVLSDVLKEIGGELQPEDAPASGTASESTSGLEPTPGAPTDQPGPIQTGQTPPPADLPLEDRRTWVNRVSYADAAITQLREPDDQGERDYFYTYGVVGEDLPAHVLRGTGIQPERPPFLVPCGSVYAVVSRLEGLPIHSAERDARLREPARKRELKREHIRVLEAISSAGYTVVPRPYGTIASGEDKIARTIAAQGASFEAALERLKGRREWSVQLFKAENPPVEAPTTAEAEYAGGDAHTRIYDLGLESGPSAEDESEESGLVAVIKRSIYNALLSVASDATMNATYGARTENGLMVLNAAYLVDVEHEENFLETANRMIERQKSLGFALITSGPRVPLSFWQ